MTQLERVSAFLNQLNEGQTDLRLRLQAEDFDPEWQGAIAGLNRMLERVAATVAVLDGAVGKISVKEALNVLQLRQLTEVMTSQHGDVERLGDNVGELAQAISRVADDSHSAAEATSRMKDVGISSLDLLRLMVTAVQGLEGQAGLAAQTVQNLVDQSRSAAGGLREIRSVAATTQMLAINAAIQAAHVNNPAFAVVAQEMRRLADRTTQLTKEIERDVTAMEQATTAAGSAMQDMAEAAASTAEQAGQAAANLEEIRSLIGDASLAGENIAAVTEEQAAATEELAAAAEELTGRVTAAMASLDLTRNVAVTGVAERAHAALGLFRIGSGTDQMRDLLNQLAADVEGSIERSVQEGTVRQHDLWDTNYREIRGAEIADLGRLFAVDRVAPSGFTPPKYRVSYDHLVDIPLVDLLDRYLNMGRLTFCTVLDVNAFAIAQPRRLAQDWTGVAEQDLLNNRAKRIFNDVHGRKAARVGLPESLLGQERVTREAIAAVGVLEADAAAARTFLLQAYARDTGEVLLDMAVPLYVHGKRWGTVRMGYRPAES